MCVLCDGHITPHFKAKLKVFNSIPAIIPETLTVLPSLDMSVRLWEQWMTDSEYTFTATGSICHSTFLQAIEWIDQAWTSVTTEAILSGFRKAEIFGTGTDSEPEDSHAEEEALLRLPPKLAELFRSDTENGEFNGFSDVE